MVNDHDKIITCSRETKSAGAEGDTNGLKAARLKGRR